MKHSRINRVMCIGWLMKLVHTEMLGKMYVYLIDKKY